VQQRAHAAHHAIEAEGQTDAPTSASNRNPRLAATRPRRWRDRSACVVRPDNSASSSACKLAWCKWYRAMPRCLSLSAPLSRCSSCDRLAHSAGVSCSRCKPKPTRADEVVACIASCEAINEERFAHPHLDAADGRQCLEDLLQVVAGVGHDLIGRLEPVWIARWGRREGEQRRVVGRAAAAARAQRKQMCVRDCFTKCSQFVAAQPNLTFSTRSPAHQRRSRGSRTCRKTPCGCRCGRCPR